MITYKELKNKIAGCWNGKNIGGCLGAPYEGPRKINDVSFYDDFIIKNPPANDDLDLQVLWLNAVERFGKFVNSDVLSEYFSSYVIPNWVEYGSAKTNLRAGLKPPFSGIVDNDYHNSNGCFIRSEIWACLCPGLPDKAAEYAYNDAIIDHGNEGVYSEIFCATAESAAFIENDAEKLINIGLSYIPEDCACAKAVRIVLEEYKKGTDWKQVRIRLLSEITCNFGVQDKPYKTRCDKFPLAKPGYDAACHIGFLSLCWLYGEGDFEKTVCLAVNIGDDADCTAATIGSLLGIILGNDALPEKWVKPLNNKIVTKCINITSPGITAPATIDEMTDRVLACIPAFLGKKCDLNFETDKYSVNTRDKDSLSFTKSHHLPLIDTNTMEQFLPIERLNRLSPYSVVYNFPTFNAVLDFHGENRIGESETKKVTLTITDNGILNEQRWLEISVFAKDGLTVSKGQYKSCALQITHDYAAVAEIEFTAEQLRGPKAVFYIDVQVANHPTTAVIKGFFLSK